MITKDEAVKITEDSVSILKVDTVMMRIEEAVRASAKSGSSWIELRDLVKGLSGAEARAVEMKLKDAGFNIVKYAGDCTLNW